MLQTATQEPTSNMAMLESTLFILSFPESQTLRCLYWRIVCVCPPAARLSRYMMSYFWRPPKHRTFHFPTISNNNMADTRIFEAVATRASHIWWKSINVYVALEYYALCTVMCVWGTGWGKSYCSTVGRRICVTVKELVNECTAKLTLNLESVIVCTARLRSRVSPKVFHVCDFPTVSTVQHNWCSGAQGLWLPLYKSLFIIMFLFYGIKITVRHRL